MIGIGYPEAVLIASGLLVVALAVVAVVVMVRRRRTR